jgi:hypothetical protein
MVGRACGLGDIEQDAVAKLGIGRSAALGTATIPPNPGITG